MNSGGNLEGAWLLPVVVASVTGIIMYMDCVVGEYLLLLMNEEGPAVLAGTSFCGDGIKSGDLQVTEEVECTVMPPILVGLLPSTLFFCGGAILAGVDL